MQSANSFSTENNVSAGPVGWRFDFRASKVLVLNDKAAAVWVSLGSTVGSSAGHRTCAGESLSIEGSNVEALGIFSGTTTTATNVRVSAWGW